MVTTAAAVLSAPDKATHDQRSAQLRHSARVRWAAAPAEWDSNTDRAGFGERAVMDLRHYKRLIALVPVSGFETFGPRIDRTTFSPNAGASLSPSQPGKKSSQAGNSPHVSHMRTNKGVTKQGMMDD
ncbi:hypothetical protein PoB_003021600 [Plakobranchus ocellatus]|uniref:Uncharacterized protein n=1 Tax=Plakobranchus ocellatus TaxID=259542 RepID=A0AAV4A622_9GAST|nr:hypothetical protein PoB_003021600 [Plakobranchus ocellatus]